MATLAMVPLSSPASQRAQKLFAAADLQSGSASMQQVVLPARMARIAYVPGTSGKEAWGIALSSATVPGWHTEDPAGQVVFMHYLAGQGWQVYGPPTTSTHVIQNPTLYALDIAPNGEGWAVGESGSVVHHVRGGGWIVESSKPTSNTLHAVSLVPSGSGVAGFAVGEGHTVLALANGAWKPDSGTTTSITQDLSAVSARTTTDAWAVSGSASTDKGVHVYQRSGTSWTEVQNLPAPVGGAHPQNINDGMVVSEVSGASVAAAKDGAWVGGVMHVTNATDPFGDDLGRPFMLHIAGTTQTLYCPDAYIAGATNTTTKQICPHGFPQSAFDVTSINVLAGGEVFAGGLGLYHFVHGAWDRLPDSNGYLISTAFASVREGWVASTGDTYGAGGTAYSSVLSVGHWTTDPQTPRMARWPQANENLLEAVALAPDGSGDALAVGQLAGDGFARTGLVKYTHGRTWDRVDPKPTDKALHAVAWPETGSAWAVGERGAILHFNGTRWDNDPASESITNGRALFGVAFNGDTGYAVGAAGTILLHLPSGWSVDGASGSVTKKTLYAIARTPTGFLAVGEAGTILQNAGGAWHVAASSAGSNLLATIGTLTDGSTLVGGAHSTLLRRAPGSNAWSSISIPVDGTIVAAGGSPASLFVSVTQADTKYAGDRLAAPQTMMLLKTPAGWQDVQLAARRSIYPDTNDPSRPADGVYGIVVDPSGRGGWAVGGSVKSTPDDEGHSFSEDSAAVYRFDLDRDPAPPSDLVLPKIPAGASSFAFFGESSCGRGLCSAAVGSGQYADVITRQIQEEVNRVAALPNGPKLTLFGGSMRSSGQPDELKQFRAFLNGFDTAVYAAPGTKDSFTPTSAGVLGQQATTSPNNYWLTFFAGESKPWGHAKPPVFIQDQDWCQTAAPQPSVAATHYSFKVLDKDGKPRYGVIVLDSSRKNISNSGQSPNEDQQTYLTCAYQHMAGLPSIIVMNQPTVNPYNATGQGSANWAPPADTFYQSIASNGTVAVFQSGFPINVYYDPVTGGNGNAIRFNVSGGGGRPYEMTKVASDGFYPTWLLGIVTGHGDNLEVTTRSMPIIDSIALHALDGLFVPGGNVLRFDGLARFPQGGYSDPEQSRAQYLPLPPPPNCQHKGLGNGDCTYADSLQPDYQFSTSDPSKAEFVKWDYGKLQPDYDIDGNVIPDPHSGFLCTFQAGDVDVYVSSGMHRSQPTPVTISGGKGPCVQEEVKPTPTPPIPPPTAPAKSEAHQVYRAPIDVNKSNAAIFPPIPAPVVAPAPPGAPGVGRKEEHEPSHETEGHNQPNKYTSIALVRRPDLEPAEAAWPILGGVLLLSLMSASMFVAVRQRRPDAQKERLSR